MSNQRRKVRVGRVVSDSMDKTVIVTVEWKRPHALYKKPVRRRSRMKAHDADNSCRLGDTVEIVESRPLSKTKRWRVKEILSRIEIAEVQPEDITIEEDVLKAPVSRPDTEPAANEVDIPSVSGAEEPELEPEPEPEPEPKPEPQPEPEGPPSDEADEAAADVPADDEKKSES